MNYQQLGPDQTIDFKKYYFYGFLINLLPIYVFYPIRTAKTIQQSNIGTSSSTSFPRVVAERVKSEGARGLYKGVGVYALGSIGGRLVHFSTYDALRDRVHKGRGRSLGLGWLENCNQTTINAFLGTLSAITTSSFMVPFDVISQQLQVSKSNSSKNTNTNNVPNSSALPKRQISTTTTTKQPTFVVTTTHDTVQIPSNINKQFNVNKSLLSKNFITRLKPKDVPLYKFLYRGWAAGLLNTISFFPAYFFTYTYTLEQLRQNKYHLSFLPSSHFLFSVIAGVLAGTTATLTSAPFDVVKTKIQIARRAGQGELKWLNVATNIVKNEGIKGLFVGLSARLWIIVPLGSLNFWVFEKVREWSTVNSVLDYENEK
ncbi:mitochondrial carrier domain-containing protein [Glomus cerebriforme]|uniref:Mitochondrial carrier domain-containing protein n=1 Tax=Glomus cerebriforme TaxID=658196 RepID=A0A397SWG1_9GLOM|nr:mitochondrial carrier domain-containing protein [Glomus cerebriforme]